LHLPKKNEFTPFPSQIGFVHIAVRILDFNKLGTGRVIRSDKNSLFDRGSIGVMGLCVKKNKSQYMGVLGYPVARPVRKMPG